MDILTTEQFAAIENPTPQQVQAWQQHLKATYLSDKIIGENQHEALVNVLIPSTLGLGPMGIRFEPVTVEAYERAYAMMADTMYLYAQKIGLVAA